MSAKSLLSQRGRSEIKMTLRLYAHAFESAMKEEQRVLIKCFGKIIVFKFSNSMKRKVDY